MRTRSPSPIPRHQRRGILVVLVMLLGVLFCTPAATAADPTFEVTQSTLDAALRCPATFSHLDHEPVLLVHGTGTNYDESWAWGYADALGSMGYDVCGVDLPAFALVDAQVSSEYVANAIIRIRARSGRKVDVVGHSQGNLEIRWAVKWWPAARVAVDDAVLLGSPSHGGLSANSACLLGSCSPVAWQTSVDSDFLGALNAGDETPGSIFYTSIYTRTDEVVQPWTSSITQGARNIAIQDVCAGRPVSHGGLLFDAVTFRLTVDALSHTGAADPGRLAFTSCLAALAPRVTPAEVFTAESVTGPMVLARITLAPQVSREPALKSYTS